MRAVLEHPPGGGVRSGQHAHEPSDPEVHLSLPGRTGRSPRPLRARSERHERLRASRERPEEVAKHRAIAGEVGEAREDQPADPPRDEHEEPVRLEHDRALGPPDARELEAAQGRWRLPRVLEGADRAVRVLDHHERAALGALGRPGPEAPHRSHRRPEVGQEVDPVDPSLEEGAARRLRAPAGRALLLERVHLDEQRPSDRARRQELPEGPGERLVAVVLGHQHAPTASRLRLGPRGRNRPARVKAGFSTITSLPRSRASSTSSRCDSGGVATKATSMRPSARAAP